MFSFKERLETFKHWPSERNKFTQRLALIGQYSMKNNTTCCFHCHKEHTSWNFDENPLMAHFSLNSTCPIFKLFNKVARRTLCRGFSPYRKFSAEIENLVEKNFIQLNIDDRDSFYCMKCGSNNSEHKCLYLKVQKITENMDFTNAQFYIRYLNGDFTELSENQKAVINELFTEYHKGEPFECLGAYLENCTGLIYDDIEKRMKKIEKDAFDSMYNETMLL